MGTLEQWLRIISRFYEEGIKFKFFKYDLGKVIKVNIQIIEDWRCD